MTGQRPLDAAVLAVSLFNTILLLWLGLTVLLNAEHRTWAIGLAGGGLLMAAGFLAIHTGIFAQGWSHVSWGMDLSWHAGWVLVILLPMSWYVLMLWYAGFWEGSPAPLHRRQAPWLTLSVTFALGLVGLLIFANPFPTYSQIVDYESSATLALGRIPFWGLLYPLYILLCISLSLDALWAPAPSGRMMGDLARQRARPWLIATSLALLMVSGLVAWVVLLIMLGGSRGALAGTAQLRFTVAWFDVIIDSLIAAAVLLLGQAIVAYEIFTGKTLPRRGLARHWRAVVALAAGYALLTGGSLTTQLRPVYGLLLATILMTAAYALLSWRSYSEREQYMAHLRPFVASFGLYEHLLTGPAAAPPDVDLTVPFRALVDEVLGAKVAYLAALGPLAALAGPPLAALPGATPATALAALAARFRTPQDGYGRVDPGDYGGAAWAVPLWSQRGLIGVLLLGEKSDGGLYTQEEIDIARASGERLIDTQASLEMARRLMALQRQRLVESQASDQRTRRVLHDDVLPRLHTAILDLSASQPGPAELLAGIHRQVSGLLRDMPAGAPPELARLGLAGALRQVAERELGGAFDAVAWEVEPEAERRAASLPPRTAEVLFCAGREAVRNAARHGRGGDASRPLRLTVGLTWSSGLQLCIEDSGVGLGDGRPRSASGGHGLALHSTMMAVIGGSLAVDSLPGAYTRVTLTLPQEAWPGLQMAPDPQP